MYRIVRQLGENESFYAKMNAEGCDLAAMAIHMSTHQMITERALRQCMTWMMHRHPMLRMSIVEKEGNLFWVETCNWKPDLRITESTDVERVVAQDLNERFSSSSQYFARGPLWRCTLMPQAAVPDAGKGHGHHYVLILNVHHAAGDGQACIKVIDELLQKLSPMIPNGTASSLDLVPPQSLEAPPSLLSYVNISLHLQSLMQRKITPDFKLEMKEKARKILENKQGFERCLESDLNYQLKVGNIKSRDNLNIRFFPYIFDEKATFAIRQACRHHKVTVQSVLQAAATIAACRIILDLAKSHAISLESLGESYVYCNASFAKDKRMVSNENQSFVQSLLYIISCTIDIRRMASDDVDLWEIAGEMLKTLRDEREESMEEEVEFSVCNQDVWSVLPKKRWNLLDISNLGNCNFLNNSARSNIKVTGICGAFALQHIGPVFNNVVVLINDELHWTVNYFPEFTSKQLAERFIQDTAQILQRNCNEGAEGGKGTDFPAKDNLEKRVVSKL